MRDLARMHRRPSPAPLRPFPSPALALIFGAILGTFVACGKPPAGGPGGPPGGGGALPVQIEPVQETDIAEASEYLATLKSRHSVNVQPQVEGVVTRIFVKSGDRVAPGAPLLQIDPAKQQATVHSQEATQASKKAAMEYARQQKLRIEALAKAGVVSRQSSDEAAAAFDQAQADYRSLGAQVEEQQVELRYYRVAAPAAGVVGDIPVRMGDRVTAATLLTTIDQASGLEAYVSIPLERAKDLKPGLPVELLGDDGQVREKTAINFISPQVDDQTQSVLVKAPVANTATAGLRAAQLVRARVIWSSHRGAVLPVLAATRQSGQYFAFVAEPPAANPADPSAKTPPGSLVAHQRPVQLGEVIGNNYVVLAGLKPGERVITSGVQKLADGMPVTPANSAP